MNTATQVPMDDYGVVTAPDTVRIERLLPGPIERVWEYLTESRAARANGSPRGEWTPRVGGRIELVFNNSALTENDDPPPPSTPSTRANHGWKAGSPSSIRRACSPTPGANPTTHSHVRFELSAQGDQVRLVVTHSRLPSREQMLSVAAGWHTHLDILRAQLAGRTPEGFWRAHTRMEGEYARRIPA